jgi:hypothetical protein
MIAGRSISRFSTGGAVAIMLLALSVTAASAAGAYDGNWVIDFLAAGYNSGSGDYTCPAARLEIKITDNQISGLLGRTGTGDTFASGQGSPITGSVKRDGSISAKWQNYAATGKLGAHGGQVAIVRGECGPRKGTAIRISQ